MVHGSSPCGPTSLEAAHCAAFSCPQEINGRGVYIPYSGAERMTLEVALKHHLSEISPPKKPTTQRAEATKASS